MLAGFNMECAWKRGEEGTRLSQFSMTLGRPWCLMRAHTLAYQGYMLPNRRCSASWVGANRTHNSPSVVTECSVSHLGETKHDLRKPCIEFTPRLQSSGCLGNEGPPAQGQAPSHYGSSEQAQKEDFSFFLAMLGVHEGGVDTVSWERECLALQAVMANNTEVWQNIQQEETKTLITRLDYKNQHTRLKFKQQ